ncbi:MAG: ATP-NAD kinase family protein [Chloroflexi bacterium]|nr:ATP-NAD kinase family protein [Chloroflexota bacterium]
MRLGLIVNPVAGLGGRVGLKGSDGVDIQQVALARGAEPLAQLRTQQALAALLPLRDRLELLTAPYEMGADVAQQSGFAPKIVGTAMQASMKNTNAEDTIHAAREMLAAGVDLILFAGGDGTARDILAAVGVQVPVLGIPAGVKIHSAVFATHPRVAGQLAADFLSGERIYMREAEVVDLDEAAYRVGLVGTRLYGYLKVPYRPHLLQNRKAPTPASESARAQAIAASVIENMLAGWLYIIGPGTTTRAIAERLGFPKTLVGVDVYDLDGLVALDADEASLLKLLEKQPAQIIVTPIGGQGFIFGRGNQQISPKVLKKVGRENIIVVSLSEKINALMGEPLLVDTGESDLDASLCGYFPVITGYHEKVIYRVAA